MSWPTAKLDEMRSVVRARHQIAEFLPVDAAWRGHGDFSSLFYISCWIQREFFCENPGLCGTRHRGFLRGGSGSKPAGALANPNPAHPAMQEHGWIGLELELGIKNYLLVGLETNAWPLDRCGVSLFTLRRAAFFESISSSCYCLSLFRSFSRSFTPSLVFRIYIPFRCAPSYFSVPSPASSAPPPPPRPVIATRPLRTSSSPRTSSTTSVHSPPPPPPPPPPHCRPGFLLLYSRPRPTISASPTSACRRRGGSRAPHGPTSGGP